MIDDKLQKAKELAIIVRKVLALEKDLKDQMEKATNAERERLSDLIKEAERAIIKIREYANEEFGGIRQRTKEAIDRLFVKNDVNKKLSERLKEADELLADVSQKLALIRNGRDGKDGEKGEKGDKGEPGKDADITGVVEEVLSKVKVPEVDYGRFDELREDLYRKIEEELRRHKRMGGGTSAIGVKQAFKWFGVDRSTTVTTNTTLDKTVAIVLANATSGNITLTLPSASDANEREYHIKKIDSSTNTVTLAVSGSETIDGESSIIISRPYTSRRLYSDGTNYFII